MVSASTFPLTRKAEGVTRLADPIALSLIGSFRDRDGDHD